MKTWKVVLIAAGCALSSASVVAWAAQTNYLGTVFIADTTTPSNQLKVNSDGSINIGSGGGGSPSYAPLTPSQYGLAIVSATALTAPATADFADVQAIGQTVNYTLDGTTTPTSSVGSQLYVGQHLYLYGASMIAAAKFIQAGATATLNVNYAK